VLAATGIYGLLSYSVAQRVPEIGVRIALGARGKDVVLLVAHHATLVVGAGILGGLAGSLAASRVLRGLLFGVGPTDPATLALVTLAFVGVGLVSCYVPVRRASRIDPVVALRTE
jgi:putative ABC transport system permease protein